jgi:hypothetical protein
MSFHGRTLLGLALIFGSAAHAEDYNSIAAINLFTTTCVRNLANPDDVRAAAKTSRYAPITDAGELAYFVGNGGKGAAWRLPSSTGARFTLSLRAETQTCAVWVERAERESVEAEFRKMVMGAGRPGITVKTESDETLPIKGGRGRMLTMSVTDTKVGDGYLFTFIGGDTTGALFSGQQIQMSMQMSRVAAPKK